MVGKINQQTGAGAPAARFFPSPGAGRPQAGSGEPPEPFDVDVENCPVQRRFLQEIFGGCPKPWVFIVFKDCFKMIFR